MYLLVFFICIITVIFKKYLFQYFFTIPRNNTSLQNFLPTFFFSPNFFFSTTVI